LPNKPIKKIIIHFNSQKEPLFWTKKWWYLVNDWSTHSCTHTRMTLLCVYCQYLEYLYMFEKSMHNYEINKQSFVLLMLYWQLYMCLGMLIIEYFWWWAMEINEHVLWSCMEECITFLKHIYQPISIHFHKYENLCTIWWLHSTWFQLLALQNYEKCFSFTRQVHPRMYMV